MRCKPSLAVALAFPLLLALSGSLSAAQPEGKMQPVRPARPPFKAVEPLPLEQPDRNSQREPVFRVHRPVIRVGLDYVVPAGTAVYEVQDVLGDVTIDGRVDHDVVVTLGSARLGSTAVINGSLVVIGGTATIASGALVHRDLIVVGGALEAPTDFYPDGTQMVIGTPAVGRAVKSVVPWLTWGLLWGRLIVPSLAWVWAIVGIVLLVGLAVNLVFNRPVRACADAILQRPLSCFLLGLFVLLLTVPALAILGASVIGLALVPFVLCAVIAAGLVGKVGVDRAIGGTVVTESSPDSRFQSLRSFLIGFAVLCLAYMVPLVGIVTWALTSVLGLGAAAITFRVALRKEHPARARVPEVRVAQPAPAAYAQAVSAAEFDGSGVPVEAVPAEDAPVSAPPLAAAGLAAYPRATFLDRVAAFALDCILVAIAIQVLDLDHYGGAFFLWLFVYHAGFWAWRGTTMGGIICGLRLTRTQGTDLRVIDAVVRGLASVFSFAALGIGCLWMLQDPERQMWHDKIAGTLVVKVPRQGLLG